MARITLDIPDELAANLKAQAAAGGIEESAFYETALRRFQQETAEFLAFIAEGEADVAAGRVLDFGEVMDEIDARIEQAKSKRQ